MFELPEEHRMLQELVARFIDRDVMPLEKAVLAREMSGQKSSLPPEEEAKLLATCKELGLWGLDVPEAYGGANLPYAEGRARSSIAISEPGAGGDPAGMTTRAVKDGADWVINGRKIWVSGVPRADFVIVMARTGEGKRHDGVTAFIVERDTPGFIIEREIPMLGGQRTYELVF